MARYPAHSYVNKYGNLTITVKSIGGAYVAFIRRPSDGYEVGIETLEHNPIGAARYALQYLADLWNNPSQKSRHQKLNAAAKEIGQDASEALKEVYEGEESLDLSGAHDEEPREGDIWFQVVHEPKKPGQFIVKYRTKQGAEDHLRGLLEDGWIKPNEKDQWGVEEVKQGKGQTEVYRVRVS
jgi:hypothetical protein